MRTKTMFFLADDDVDDQMLFKEALAEIDPDLECTVAKNGEEALVMLKNNLPQLPDYVFLDMNMPRMSGMRCLEELKKLKEFQEVPIIMYSTSSQKEYIEESRRLGAKNFFVKPSSFSELVTYLQSLTATSKN